MNLNYAIFRSQPIMTLNDLQQIGSYNKREKQAYKSNPDIKLNMSQYNVELVPLAEKYVKGFYNITKDYRKEHEERMKKERTDRKKTFNQMLNNSKNVVADELMFTATNEFFKDMNKEQILDWANTCMEFVYKDLGYKKEQVLHSTIHLDEKTPHIHCVVIPLIKKLDKRTNTERYTISKKQYVRDKIHLSELQDKYHKRLTDKGYDLERGIKGSDSKHIKIKEYKRITSRLEKNLNIRNIMLNNAMNEFEERMKTTKNIPFDKKHVILEKDTFDSMNNVINETKKIMEIQPKLEEVFKEVNNYTNSYKFFEKENKKYEREITALKIKNHNLTEENNILKSYIKSILEMIKQFFGKILQLGNEATKEVTTSEIKTYYDNKNFNDKDIIDVSRGTTKEDELFEYADIPDYYKTRSGKGRDKDDDFGLSL